MADITKARETLSGKSEVDQNQYVLDYMHQHSKCDGDDCVYVIGGIVVCEAAWRVAMGFKRTRFRSLKSKAAGWSVTCRAW